MNGNDQNGNNLDIEKAFPGCLGRMVSLFELNAGVSANRMLTYKPHRNGPHLSMSSSDVTRMSLSADQMEEKVVISEFRNSYSNSRSHGKPIKMLIDQEMSKDVDSRCSPNVIAKLMGLDTLPRQASDLSNLRSYSKSHPQSHSDIPRSYCETPNGFSHPVNHNENKGIDKTLKKSPLQGRCNETTNDQRMVLVRQKFIEAKRLSMDEKLRQTKQFQDALEVLNANKDLFLNCLQEPNSIFSQNLYNQNAKPLATEMKRITVLRPSKMVQSGNFFTAGNKDGKQLRNGSPVLLNGSEKSRLINSSPEFWKSYESPSKPTRIVVLKPSPVKSHEMKAANFPQSESPRTIYGEDIFGDVEDDENEESREVAKAITKQMREKLGKHPRDEALTSCALSNGYVGDESSFNKSEIEYVAGNLSDSEVMSPTSRHSWDYVNRIRSPCSFSSFSRVAYSPESSVSREAKKRLSERWSLLASNGNFQDKRHVRKNSSTLGEMLALSETKKAFLSEEEGSLNEPEDSNPVVHDKSATYENVTNSPRNLMRSKSVPVLSTVYGSQSNTDLAVPDNIKADDIKGQMKARGAKSSLKGKMSSLFFSRNKKAIKENTFQAEIEDQFLSRINPGQSDGKNEGPHEKDSESFSHGVPEPSSQASSANGVNKPESVSSETGSSMEAPSPFGNSNEKLNQPSPVSVLDPPFDDDEHTSTLFQPYAEPGQEGVGLPLYSIRSNLIDKSPHIGSIARTLSWDDSCVNTASSYSREQLKGQRTAEEREWFFFMRTLLSEAGLLGKEQYNTFISRWHSPESPLDPMLRDKYIDFNEKEVLLEANRRHKRSTRKLVFDCVNAALVEIAGYGSQSGQRAISCIKASNSISENTSFTVLDEVWTRTSIWFSGQFRYASDDCSDYDSLVMESAVKKEVVGKGWISYLRLDMDNLGKEIEGKLLEELVQEAVVELTGSIVRPVHSF